MLKRYLSTFVVMMISFTGISQKIEIKGNAKSYAGEVLFLKCYDDLITFKEKDLAQCMVNKDGNFLFSANIREVCLAFIHLNVFKGLLYIEPGKNYEIVLPQKVQKLPEDELNPFFEETEFFIRILHSNGKELNELIESFSGLYQQYLQKYFDQFKGTLNKTTTDSIIRAIDQSFEGIDNPFFNDYRFYSYTSLRLMAYERNKEKLIETAFFQKPVLYNNPAYMDIFNQLFANYLSAYSKTDHGKEIPYFLVREKSLAKIKSSLSLAPYLQNNDLQDLIIVKSLFDNFYKEDFPRESIIFMTDSVRLTAKEKQNRIIAGNALEKMTTLLPNYPAPDFELPDKNLKMHSLGSSNGKFVYLSFINPKSYTALQELEVLKKLALRKFEMLEIITICVCNKMEEMQKLIKDKSYNWKFLHYSGNTELIKNYNLRVYPTYYMINPEGKLAMSPAFPPTEASFEARYFDLLKAWKIELERKKAKGLKP